MKEIINKKKLSTDVAFEFCGTAIIKQYTYRCLSVLPQTIFTNYESIWFRFLQKV